MSKDLKVYLIHTPDYATFDCNRVEEILTSVEGSIKFITETTPVTKKGREYSSEGILSWDEMFDLCTHYRKTHKNVRKTDFVVLLTSVKNERNWFSHFNERDVFVHTGGWDKYVERQPHFPIAHQVIENILQVLMKVGKVNSENPYIHYLTKGCINDMCVNKLEVTIKLRMADTCKTCRERIDEQIDPVVKKQIMGVLRFIREELLNLTVTSKSDGKPRPILINSSREVSIPHFDNKIIFTKPSWVALYLFYLKHLEGVSLKELADEKYRVEIENIYSDMKGDGTDSRDYYNRLVRRTDSTFNTYRSSINKAIVDALGADLAKFYIIDGKKGGKFQINLPKELIDIRF